MKIKIYKLVLFMYTKSNVTYYIIEIDERYGANNYNPLPIVFSEAEGVIVKDPEGKEYIDMLSAYSAVNQGHRHPKIVKAVKNQLDKVTLSSRAFHNELLEDWSKLVNDLTNTDRVLHIKLLTKDRDITILLKQLKIN